MDEVKTATGKIFLSDYVSAIPNPQQLYIRLLNVPLSKVASVFSSREETAQLWCGDYYFSGYTNLIALVPEPGAIKVVLSKE